MSMFPNAESRIIRNEDGEVLGWDQPSNDEADPDEFYERMETAGRSHGQTFANGNPTDEQRSMELFPALYGQVVTERHVRICQENGHATHSVSGADEDICPRCGDVKMSEAEVQGRVSGAVSSTVIHDHVEYDDQGNRTVVVDSEETWTKDLGICQWFALCENQATHTMTHPILGEVPICDRCQEKYDKL